MGASDVIAIVSVVVTAIGIGVSAFFAKRSIKAAGRSEDAEGRADTQVKALVAIAEAMKIQAAESEEKRQQRAEQVSAEEMAPWKIVRTGNQAWDLVNRTATPKYAVSVTGPAILSNRVKVIALVAGHAEVPIPGAIRSMQTNDDLVVTWHRAQDLSDELLELPGRLPKS